MRSALKIFLSNMDDKQKFIALAQDKKNISIAFFNASNAAIALYASLPAAKKAKVDMVEFIRTYREVFIGDYTAFHKSVVSQVGKTDDSEVADALASIDACLTLEALKTLWVDVLTEDLRRMPAIIAAKEAKKKSYAAN